jgi:parvulin-like peptidyl-prolyl isomerase
MNKHLIWVLLIPVILIACSSQSKEATLAKGTPAYQLAVDLAAILPALDPASEQALIRTKDFTVTTSEVIQSIQDSMGNRTAQLKQMGADQLKSVIRQNARSLAERKLLLEAVRQAGGTLPAEKLDSFLQEQYRQAGGEEQFQAMLADMGLDLARIKGRIHADLLIQNYLDGVVARSVVVSDEEIEQAYQEDKSASVRHILLMTREKSENEKAAIHSTMQELHQRARSGEDFAALAREYSEDPGSKGRGGLYEDFTRGTMVKPFEDAAFSVPVGEISDIIETQYGFHILKVEGRKREERPLEEVRPELEERIKEQKKGDAYLTLIDNLKSNSGFEVLEF